MAFGGDKPARCALASKSIVGYSSFGLAQVSNLGDIQVTCRVPARQFATKPGTSRNGLRAATTAYEISADSSKRLVPSEAHRLGGGSEFGPGPETEWVDFYIHIPLQPAELDAEARRYLAEVEKSAPPEQITAEAPSRGWNGFVGWFINILWVTSKWRAALWMMTACWASASSNL